MGEISLTSPSPSDQTAGQADTVFFLMWGTEEASNSCQYVFSTIRGPFEKDEWLLSKGTGY